MCGEELTLVQQEHFTNQVFGTFHRSHLHTHLNDDPFVFKREAIKRIYQTSCSRVWEDIQTVLPSASSFLTR